MNDNRWFVVMTGLLILLVVLQMNAIKERREAHVLYMTKLSCVVPVDGYTCPAPSGMKR